uniref:Uncharacterized protein n=1 Tax=Anopheles coluzzii TaxID=1518534 RepID=A0A8W7P7X9_ANOCL
MPSNNATSRAQAGMAVRLFHENGCATDDDDDHDDDEDGQQRSAKAILPIGEALTFAELPTVHWRTGATPLLSSQRESTRFGTAC